MSPETLPPILDAEQLARRSMGSEALRVELLALFSAEAERLVVQASNAADGPTRRDRLAALEALAGGIGARRLAEAARTAQADAEGRLDGVREALAAVLARLAAEG